MKRVAAALAFVLVACDPWTQLSADAKCRQTRCDAGMGGGSGGGQLPTPLNASCDGDGGPAPVLWRSGGTAARALAGEGSSVVFVGERMPGSGTVRQSVTPCAGPSSTTWGSLDNPISAYQLGSDAVTCGNLADRGRVTWIDPATGDSSAHQGFAVGFRFETCNVYPLEDGGISVAAWGTADGGQPLLVTSGPPGGPYSTFTVGSCDAGRFFPNRIRYSPYGGAGVLTGNYIGSCELYGSALPLAPAPPASGFITRAPHRGVPSAAVTPSNGLFVSASDGVHHYAAHRSAGDVTVSRLAPNDNDPTQRVVTFSMTPLLREVSELVPRGVDAGVFVVGAIREGPSASFDRDVWVAVVGNGPARVTEYTLQAAGDQEVAGAVWLAGPRLLAVTGMCLPSRDGGPAPDGLLCTGDGGVTATSWLVFLDPSRF